MLLMYDGIDVSKWPDGVTEGLVYTDGRYANEAAAKARFPDATFQTVSATGQAAAMWIDCEPGCVWPPSAAAELFRSWQSKGCRGIYCNQSAMNGVLSACQAIGVTPEIFDANWTGTEHIDPGAAETQFESTPGYDVSAIPDPATVTSSPPPPHRRDLPMDFVAVSTDGADKDDQYLVTTRPFSKLRIATIAAGQAYMKALGQADIIPISSADLASFPDVVVPAPAS